MLLPYVSAFADVPQTTNEEQEEEYRIVDGSTINLTSGQKYRVRFIKPTTTKIYTSPPSVPYETISEGVEYVQVKYMVSPAYSEELTTTHTRPVSKSKQEYVGERSYTVKEEYQGTEEYEGTEEYQVFLKYGTKQATRQEEFTVYVSKRVLVKAATKKKKYYTVPGYWKDVHTVEGDGVIVTKKVYVNPRRRYKWVDVPAVYRNEEVPLTRTRPVKYNVTDYSKKIYETKTRKVTKTRPVTKTRLVTKTEPVFRTIYYKVYEEYTKTRQVHHPAVYQTRTVPRTLPQRYKVTVRGAWQKSGDTPKIATKTTIWLPTGTPDTGYIVDGKTYYSNGDRIEKGTISKAGDYYYIFNGNEGEKLVYFNPALYTITNGEVINENDEIKFKSQMSVECQNANIDRLRELLQKASTLGYDDLVNAINQLIDQKEAEAKAARKVFNTIWSDVGEKMDGYILDGKTYKLSGERIGFGWVSSVNKTFYQLTPDGPIKVDDFDEMTFMSTQGQCKTIDESDREKERISTAMENAGVEVLRTLLLRANRCNFSDLSKVIQEKLNKIIAQREAKRAAELELKRVMRIERNLIKWGYLDASHIVDGIEDAELHSALGKFYIFGPVKKDKVDLDKVIAGLTRSYFKIASTDLPKTTIGIVDPTIGVEYNSSRVPGFDTMTSASPKEMFSENTMHSDLMTRSLMDSLKNALLEESNKDEKLIEDNNGLNHVKFFDNLEILGYNGRDKKAALAFAKDYGISIESIDNGVSYITPELYRQVSRTASLHKKTFDPTDKSNTLIKEVKYMLNKIMENEEGYIKLNDTDGSMNDRTRTMLNAFQKKDYNLVETYYVDYNSYHTLKECFDDVVLSQMRSYIKDPKNDLSEEQNNLLLLLARGLIDRIYPYMGKYILSKASNQAFVIDAVNGIDDEGTGKTYVTTAQLQNIYKETTVSDTMRIDLNRVLEKYGITDVENIQHFIAQTVHETDFGRAVIEDGSDSYLNGKKYGKKYSGVGYIHMTWDYGYAAFASYMILEANPDLKDVASFKNPKRNDEETIFKAYNKLVSEANIRGYDIKQYTDIVDVGRDYVKDNFAWETAGYYWSTNDLTSVNSSTPVDDVTTIVNKWTSSYKARRDAYDMVKIHIN